MNLLQLQSLVADYPIPEVVTTHPNYAEHAFMMSFIIEGITNQVHQLYVSSKGDFRHPFTNEIVKSISDEDAYQYSQDIFDEVDDQLYVMLGIPFPEEEEEYEDPQVEILTLSPLDDPDSPIHETFYHTDLYAHAVTHSSLDDEDEKAPAVIEQEQTAKKSEPMKRLEYQPDPFYMVGAKPYSCKPDVPALVSYCPVLVGGVKNRRARPPRRRRNGRRKLTVPRMVTASQLGQVNQKIRTNDVLHTVWRYIGKVASDAVGNISTRFSIRDPQRAQDGSGSYQEITAYAGLYDEYKVLTFTLQYVPVAPVGITPLGYVMTVFDYDDPDTSNIGVVAASEYMNMKVFNSREAFRISTRVPRLSEGITTDGTPAIIHQGGFIDFNKPPVEGNMFLTGENFSPNSAIARVILTMSVMLRKKR